MIDKLCVIFFPGVKDVDMVINDLVSKHKNSYKDIIFTDEIDKCKDIDHIIVIYCDFMTSIIKMIDGNINIDNIVQSYNRLKDYIDLLNKSIENLFVESEDIDIDDSYKHFILEILEDYKQNNKK